jgi:hypothetical protein
MQTVHSKSRSRARSQGRSSNTRRGGGVLSRVDSRGRPLPKLKLPAWDINDNEWTRPSLCPPLEVAVRRHCWCRRDCSCVCVCACYHKYPFQIDVVQW